MMTDTMSICFSLFSFTVLEFVCRHIVVTFIGTWILWMSSLNLYNSGVAYMTTHYNLNPYHYGELAFLKVS